MAISIETLAIAKKFAKSYTDAVISGVAGGINYKGAVNYYSDLPNNPEQNDSYTVLYAGTSGNEPDGTQYVWAEYEGTLQWVAYGINRSLLKTFQPFRSSWTTNNTIKQFCDDINSDATAVEGMGYVGELTYTNGSDLPFQGNADTVVEIISGSGTSNKVIHVTITSGNVAPYRWEYTYWNNGVNVSGWIANTLVVIYTKSGNTITCNQTYQTVRSAIDSGQSVTGWYNKGTTLYSIMSIHLAVESDSQIIVIYEYSGTSSGKLRCSTLIHSSSGTIIAGTSDSSVLPQLEISDNGSVLAVINGNWNKAALGTIMSPNAQLDGTEPELKSLTIDGVKYKIASSNDLYQAVSTTQYGTPVNP